MSILSPRDRAMVSLGAAMGSHCVPCLEHHVPAARNAGLSDSEIDLALELAIKIQNVPAERAAARGRALVQGQAPAEGEVSSSCGEKPPATKGGCC